MNPLASDDRPAALLALEDGTCFVGRACGALGEAFGEVVFNTSMVGYQEIVTDPSYAGQIVTLTYPQVGNYGVSDACLQSAGTHLRGLVVRDMCHSPSNWQSTGSFPDFLRTHGVVAIEGVDTRALTLRIRSAGAMRAGISTVDLDPQSLVARVAASPAISEHNYVADVSPREERTIPADPRAVAARTKAGLPSLHVVAYDCGEKRGIEERLACAGCTVTTVPYDTPASRVLALEPDGVFFSNGPGDPQQVTSTARAATSILGTVPVFGICLGNQLIAMAAGAHIEKLPFGHHGGNEPVMDLLTRRVEITAQNHGFGLVFDSLGPLVPELSGNETQHVRDLRHWVRRGIAPVVQTEHMGRVRLTHVNLNDGTPEGIEFLDIPALAVQYHPESCPGPHDSRYLFDTFVELMDSWRQRRQVAPAGPFDVVDVDAHAQPSRPARTTARPVRRTDLHKILVLGSGPIVIGQACEFDYSGTQACKALRQAGYEVVLVNSNPATIMTDPQTADRTYVEPLDAQTVAKVIERERPDALLPNMGGQTALNCAVALGEAGVLDRFGVEVIGCDLDSIRTGEDRELFARAMRDIGLEVAASGFAHSLEEARAVADELGYPVVIRPSFTLGGAGGGIAHDEEELQQIAGQGIALSPASEVLVEQSIEGWKEIEMEVMRDAAGNGIVICSIENLDPMGVHTGDSITVAPAQTLSDEELQRLRDYSLACLDRVGVATGGSNVQFAVNPTDGRVIVIEMNPRVSRSSALASKATGFPIAKAAALLAVGYTLDEIVNDITRATPACFEPSLDYCVVKVPRFAFEKFKGTSEELTTRMKSVGEAMAIGRTFEEALQKALRSLEDGHDGLDALTMAEVDDEGLRSLMARPTPERIFYVGEALRRGWDVTRIARLTRIDPWYLHRMADIVRAEQAMRGLGLANLGREHLLHAKQLGFSDAQIARIVHGKEEVVRAVREALGVRPVVKTVDTCAGEFAAQTSYHYLTYEAGSASEHVEASKPRVLILCAGPNRIGQGIEFDYCCVHAAYALRERGFEAVMVNCNPETVSTDYDTSDRLYFEPLTFEDVMDVVEAERPAGVIVTLGGQTPIKLAHQLKEAGVPIMGTQPEAIDLAEDRDRFAALLDRLGMAYPPSSVASTPTEARQAARSLGYPLIVRPSYVLGGRGMAIVYDDEELAAYMDEAARVTPDHPVYLDSFLEDAIELDVDALCDGQSCYVGAVLEHIEECGIHSGDSACCYPPFSLSDVLVEQVRATTRRLALACYIRGLLNVQYAIKDDRVFVIELNPRASRTVPFSSKASGVPLARLAARVMAGESLASLSLPPEDREPAHFAVKEAVMPWARFPGSDFKLGPEMKSTGEVMGIADTFPAAYAKTREEIDYEMPAEGTVFMSVRDADKRAIAPVAFALTLMGYQILATSGTAKTLRAAGIPCEVTKRLGEGHPNVHDVLSAGGVSFIINTPHGHASHGDGALLRAEAVSRGITNVTTLSGAMALLQSLAVLRSEQGLPVHALQDLVPEEM